MIVRIAAAKAAILAKNKSFEHGIVVAPLVNPGRTAFQTPVPKKGETVMRNRLLNSFAALAVCTMVAAMASPAFGQGYRDNNRGRFDRGEIGQVIRQAENETDQFVAALGQVSDRRDGFLRGGRLVQQARSLERQLNQVRQEFERDGNDNYRGGWNNNYRIRSQVSRALSTARSINNTMRFRRLNGDVEREWAQVRADMNRLAEAFNLSRLG